MVSRKLHPAIEYLHDPKRGLFIVPKRGGDVVRYAPNKVQRDIRAAVQDDFEKGRPIRHIYLKARQQGVSTEVAAIQYSMARTRRNFTALVLANDMQTAEDLWEQKYRVFADYDAENPDRGSDEAAKRGGFFDLLSGRRLKFSDTRSKIGVRFAGKDKGRGVTAQGLHITEFPFIPDIEAFWESIRPTMLDDPATSIFIESTGSKPKDLFESMWYAAVKHETEHGEPGEWRAFFWPWTDSEEYVRLLNAEEAEALEESLTDYELWMLETGNTEEWKARHLPVTLAHIAWRRKMLQSFSGKGGLGSFQRAYPFTPEEAFASQRISIFDVGVMAWYRNAMESAPIEAFDIRLTRHKKPIIEPSEMGPVHVFIPPSPRRSYLIAADAASEHDDFRNYSESGAVVIERETGEIAATYTMKLNAETFAEALYGLGVHYRMAEIAVEAKAQGHTVLSRLNRDLAYPNLTRRLGAPDDRGVMRSVNKLGVDTNAKTRALFVDGLERVVNERRVGIHCKRLLDQMSNFCELETGRKRGVHSRDDLVIALAIAVFYARSGEEWDLKQGVEFDRRNLTTRRARVYRHPILDDDDDDDRGDLSPLMAMAMGTKHSAWKRVGRG